MSTILPEPSADAARSYFSQMCVLTTGVAAGAVDQEPGDDGHTPSYLMGRRDAFHVVVAHLASSRSLKEAADKCAAFGRGVGDRADAHPYGADWCVGFSDAAREAVADLAMYAASGTLPKVNAARLRAARAAVRHVTPFGTNLTRSAPPRAHEW